MWSCWLNHHGEAELPTDQAWLDMRFPFVDENGDRVEMAVRALFGPNSPIDYVYDDVGSAGCFRSPPPMMVAGGTVLSGDATETKGSEEPLRHIIAENVELSGMSRTVSLASTKAQGAASEALRAVTKSDQPAGRAILRLRGVIVRSQPGASIAVELVSEASGKRRRVGTIAFFAVGDRSHKHADIAGDGDRGDGPCLRRDQCLGRTWSGRS